MSKFEEVKAEFLNVLKYVGLEKPIIIESQKMKIDSGTIEIQIFPDLQSFDQAHAIFGHWIPILYTSSNNEIKNKVVKAIAKLCVFSIPLLEEMESEDATV
jgi:hypothetical protein